MKVVFLDRDGVINGNVHGGYVMSREEFEFLPGAIDGIRRLSSAGFRVIVISNQAGVGKGLMTQESLDEIDRYMISEAEAAGGKIDATYYCTHRQEDKCDCRKPAPGLLLRASRDLGVDPKDTVFVGDHRRDVLAGRAAGCKVVLVLSGAISEEDAGQVDPSPDYVAYDLVAAAEWIISSGG